MSGGDMPAGGGADAEASAPAGFVTIARVVKTQGRRGELAAELLTDFPQRFEQLQRVFLWRAPAAPQAFPLIKHWFHKGRVVLELEGIADLTQAEAWVGAEVQVPPAERVALPAGSYFVSDLQGCDVFAAGARLGRLQEVIGVPGAPALLQLQAGEGDEILIPFAAEYVVAIDLEARRLTLRLPEGLAEVNRPKAP